MATSLPDRTIGTKRKARDSAPFDSPHEPLVVGAAPASASHRLDGALRDVKQELLKAPDAAAAASAAPAAATATTTSATPAAAAATAYSRPKVTTADWRGEVAAQLSASTEDWARSLYPAVYHFLIEDAGVLEVGLGLSLDKRCELIVYNCGGDLELYQYVSEEADGLAQALGRLDTELRNCSLLDQSCYAELPAAKQAAWPKEYPRIVKFITKRPQGYVTVGRSPAEGGFVQATRGSPQYDFPSSCSKPRVVFSRPQAVSSLTHVLELLEVGLAKEHSGLRGF